jgi:predicted dehydrogenase
MYKIAIIGAGVISDFHVQGWKNISGAEITTVVDLNKDLAKEKAEKWGVKNFETDYKKILEKPDITICDICLPHFLHAGITIDLLNDGKNVLCEKPVALTIEEALEVQKAEKASGKLLMFGENWYYIPAIQKAYEIYRSGEIGEAYNFRANLDFPGVRLVNDETSNTRARSWRAVKDECGGGILLDAGIHTLSVARWFMGEPDEVIGTYGRQVNNLKDGLEDSFSALISFKNKSTGLFHFAEPAGYPGSFDFKILGEEGVIEIDIFKELVRVVTAKDKKEYTVKAKGGMTEEMEHFMECLEKGTKPISSSDDQIRSLALVFAAYQSANNNSVPVKVDEILFSSKNKGVIV